MEKKGSTLSEVPSESLTDGKEANGEPARVHWSNNVEFILSCISLSVGLGNVWRFPYLAYANGGGAFLLPYLIVLILCGKPMYFMEVAFGQHHQEGPVSIWKKVSPIGKGIGVAQIVIQFMTAMYYIIIMSWTMYYFWTTLIAACSSEPVPWGSQFCKSEWAHEETCVSVEPDISQNTLGIPVVTFTAENATKLLMQSSSQQYYDRVILQRYDKGSLTKYNLSNMGGINWILMANFAGSWLIVFLSLVKGIRSSGKVMYITSTLPFIVLFILLGRGASLPNAVEGIKYFIVPQFSSLLNIQTWRNAAEQMFYSLSVAFGALVMLGSYNKRSHNCYRDAVIVSVTDTVTSITAGIAMFSVLGYLAGRLDVGIETVAVSGPGLAFVTFPEGLNQMPLPHMWAIFFFMMLYTIGLGSEIATLETVLTAIYDRWPSTRLKKPLVCGVSVIVSFLVGIPFCCQGGVDLFEIFDSYAGGFSVLFPAIAELIIIMWVYGVSRFVDDINGMLKKKVSLYWRSTWGLLAPLTLLFILVITFAEYTPLNHGETLPIYADYVGWGLALCSIIQIPIWGGIAIYKAKGRGLKEKLHESLWPAEIMRTQPSSGMHLETVRNKGSYLSNEVHDNPTFDLGTEKDTIT